jgi:hypothetical protein
MRTISAVDAISPAIERTRDFLFRPFSWPTYLKLCLVAVITESAGSNMRSSTRGGSPDHGPHVASSFHLAPEWFVAIAIAAVVGVVVFIVLFYLVTRLRFAFLHCLIHNTKQIAPGWYLYADQATRFFWLNLGVAFGFLLLVAAAAYPFVAGFWRLFHDLPPGAHPDVIAILSLALPLIPIILLLALVGLLLNLVLRDLMLPHYALDNTSAGEAWSRVWAHIKAEKLQFCVYALLRVILPTVAAIALFIVLMIPGAALVGGLAMFGYGLHSAYAGATGAAAITGIALEVFFGLLALGLTVLASICLGGPISTAVRQYALIFYGARYQALGDILYPPPPAQTAGLNAPQPA